MNQITFDCTLITSEDDLWAKLKELQQLGWEGNIAFRPQGPGGSTLWQLSIEPGVGVSGTPFTARVGDHIVKVGNLYDAMTAEQVHARYGIELDDSEG